MWRVLIDLLIECVPMVAFFVVSFWYNFWESTLIYVALTLMVVAYLYIVAARLPYLSLIFGVFVIGSGVLTLLFDNPDILIFADSVYFFLGAAVLTWSLYTPRTAVERLFAYAFDITPEGWRILTYIWISIFLVAGISNEAVRLTMSPEWWIKFQFWRGIAINICVLGLLPISRRYRNPATTNMYGIRTKEKTNETITL